MYYVDKHGITQIIDQKINNLSINWDRDEHGNKMAVLLFTPDMDNTAEHYHIELSRGEAEALRSWLNDLLSEEEQVKTEYNDLTPDEKLNVYTIAFTYVHDNADRVANLREETQDSIAPSGYDLHRPDLWKPAHWNWFHKLNPSTYD